MNSLNDGYVYILLEFIYLQIFIVCLDVAKKKNRLNNITILFGLLFAPLTYVYLAFSSKRKARNIEIRLPQVSLISIFIVILVLFVIFHDSWSPWGKGNVPF